jgi:carnitine O-palmitoyltransferase 1, liver isoform
LLLKSWWSSNYVSDWWEEYVYLRNRESLMCGSNYYGSDLIDQRAIKQTARAASLIYLMLQFRRKIERQELKPIMVQGLVPLCSWQYERMFNTVRVPGVEGDKIAHYDDSKHVVVLHKGCYYKMTIYHKTRLLTACEIQYQLDLIVNASEKYLAWSHGEKHLASLTALNRTKWAETREKYFSEGVNKVSLQEIESSAFIVVLDDEPFSFGLNSSSKEYGYYGQQLLHGKGNDRWLDKSFNLCVGTNGRVS